MPHVRPHSSFFAIYLGAMLVGLVASKQFAWGLFYAGFVVWLLWADARFASRPTRRALVVVCATLAIGMNVFFQVMRYSVPAVRTSRYDGALYAIDLDVFGMSPNVWADRFAAPWLTELLSVAYMFFMLLLFVNLIRYFFFDEQLLERFYAGLFTVYGLGFLGYFLVPAAGPYLAYAEIFDRPLAGYAVAKANEAMVLAGSSRVDVWPSLHVAVSAFILGHLARYHRREAKLLAVPVALLWCSTIYLRYHYVADVVCGFALALFALWVQKRYKPLAEI